MATLDTLFPFKRHFITLGGHKLHYVHEKPAGINGQRPDAVVMVHGNPSWSFYYRNLVQALSDQYECVVPDHIGCGLSDKPGDDAYDYTLAQRIDDLEALLDSLGIRSNITLVLHDWGGMIGMGYAARYPERIKRLVLLNTAAFGLPKSKPLPLALKICRDTALGTLLVRGFNAFSSAASYVGVKRAPMAADVRRAYVAPFNSWQNRISTLRFVQDIPLKPGDRNWDLVQSIDASLQQFTQVPTIILWGLKDFVFDRHFLEGWQQRLPKAELHAFADCGHYILEDASDEVIAHIRRFIDETAVAKSADEQTSNPKEKASAETTSAGSAD
ncbi:alpha/beta hydrolase [Shewanella algae]|uniref:alpha/beta fold hydrolase n=1 Tax=Shewanella algae TaxID=38313 RepID=UPI00119D6D74|nr:alpha/beta fold hydrolase [Shewanella algae]TWO86198.1 alpha/beta hydrolase [Shewanella algae]